MVETHSQDAIPPPATPLPLIFGYCTQERGGECFTLASVTAEQLQVFCPDTWRRLVAAAAEQQQRQEQERYMPSLLRELLAGVDDPTTRRHVDQVVAKTQLRTRSQMIADFFTKGEK